MYEITDCLYSKMLDALLADVGGKSFFSGSVTVVEAGVECKLTATVVVCKRATYYDGCRRDEIVDLLPVWWECHTYDCGEELFNDFSFSELRRYLL